MAKPNIRLVVSEVSSNQEGIPLNTTAVTILTGGSGLKDADGTSSAYGGNLKRVTLNNSGSSTRRVKLYNVPNGQSLAEKHKFFDEQIPANSVMEYSPPIPRKYKDTATIQGTQDSGTDVYAIAEAVEFF